MAYGAGGAVCRLSILGHLSLLKKKEIDGGGGRDFRTIPIVGNSKSRVIRKKHLQRRLSVDVILQRNNCCLC